MSDRVTVHHGDSRAVLKTLAAGSVDSVVTDPPYALVSIQKRFGGPNAKPAVHGRDGAYRRQAAGFMGKAWDTGETAFDPAFWAEVWRVLKPGGHVVAFGGTRTYHRLACAIEDAGFEIRDMVAWLYGSGFPKSHDVAKGMDKLDAVQVRLDRALRFTRWMRTTRLTPSSAGALLRRAGMISASGTMAGHFFATSAAGQPAIATRDLFHALLPHLGVDVPDWVDKLVAERTVESENFKAREVIGSKRAGIANPSEGQRHTIGAAVAVDIDVTAAATPEAAAWEGWGTALKPALEPVVLARKPLSGSVAANVLAHGTGALNIDGCRIHADDAKAQAYTVKRTAPGATQNATGQTKQAGVEFEGLTKDGRWPANVVHDGSGEVVEAFPSEAGGGYATGGHVRHASGKLGTFDAAGGQAKVSRNDSGSAARFFYTAKADADDRVKTCSACAVQWRGSRRPCACPDPDDAAKLAPAKGHPTVKPVELMRWMVRLITPPGGVVLDPFAGTGTTGEAALLEGFAAILIEREADYVADIQARLAHMRGEDAPLFSFGGTDGA